MTEYIEREALMLRIDCHGTNKFGMLDEDIRAFVKAQPAADVEPVVHGEWRENGLNGFAYALICSKCGYIDGYPFNDRYRYCPNCGAKMDGGVNECD